jgi:steroid 5-alpha reductase family enzyme
MLDMRLAVNTQMPMFRSIGLLAVALLVTLIFSSGFDPFQWQLFTEGLRILLVFVLLSFVVSELTQNYSQVDKLWHVMPGFYAWYFAARVGFDARLVIMAVLVTVWGLRLAFNFGRRGGFGWPVWTGHEDYRWAILRAQPVLQSRVAWGLFNFFFISLYQHFVLFLIALPCLYATRGAGSWNLLDVLAMLFVVVCIVVETLADQQQFEFHSEKQRLLQQGLPLEGDFSRGFCSSGLFAVARHPNFAAEQLLWFGLYLFSVAATGDWLNSSLLGALMLALLFQGSTDFTEKQSLRKYPSYLEYQARVPRFLPWIGTFWSSQKTDRV